MLERYSHIRIAAKRAAILSLETGNNEFDEIDGAADPIKAEQLN
jgi:hypothetical protein